MFIMKYRNAQACISIGTSISEVAACLGGEHGAQNNILVIPQIGP